jgi:hypothetical protein
MVVSREKGVRVHEVRETMCAMCDQVPVRATEDDLMPKCEKCQAEHDRANYYRALMDQHTGKGGADGPKQGESGDKAPAPE